MKTKIYNSKDETHLSVRASNLDSEYILWQRELEGNDIYFEWDEQSNGNFNSTSECTIDYDGIHIVLKDKNMIHFYFNSLSKNELEGLIERLKHIYEPQPQILEIIK